MLNTFFAAGWKWFRAGIVTPVPDSKATLTLKNANARSVFAAGIRVRFNK